MIIKAQPEAIQITLNKSGPITYHHRAHIIKNTKHLNSYYPKSLRHKNGFPTFEILDSNPLNLELNHKSINK
ncbi:hypothetical protein LV92_01781 [Arenibacter echinorum]|uniref:Uncharacterized protein n=1 Tax=Arenibacter echinorum TaxID=440515 RepID=A0A327R8V2_9FLAO|nr:hypothetical protein LV92_01781 [Arenibacter echinorum]